MHTKINQTMEKDNENILSHLADSHFVCRSVGSRLSHANTSLA